MQTISGGDDMAWHCPYCGCSSSHYNSSRIRMECDLCGYPVSEDVDAESRMRRDRTFLQIQKHLRVGNWQKVISLVRPLTEEDPTNKELYVFILRAATKDFSDDMMDTSMRTIASDAWDKLERLNGITSQMRGYSNDCLKKKIDELENKKALLYIWVVAVVCCCFFGFCCFGSNDVFAGLLLIGIGFLIYKAKKPNYSFNLIKQIDDLQRKKGNNPF